MTQHVVLRHQSRYRYDRPVALGPHEIRLRPVPDCRAPVTHYALDLRPERHSMHWYGDAAGNPVARVLFPGRTPVLEIDVLLSVDLSPGNPFDFLVDPEAERFPFEYPESARHDLAPFLDSAENGGRLAQWLNALAAEEKPHESATVDLLIRINRRLQREIAYITRHEHGVQTVEETLAQGSGSCRDSSWLLVQILRRLGIAARFVSGYLIQLAGAPDGPKTDNADLHAWAEAYLPGAGWIGLDPTSGLLASESHIPLARASLPTLAAPVTGTVEPCRSEFEFSFSVQRRQ